MEFAKSFFDFLDGQEKFRNFDYGSFSFIDFKNSKFETFNFSLKEKETLDYNPIFDLASLTKPLTMGMASIINKDQIRKEVLSLVEHRAGLPAFGRLKKESWKENISSFPLKESDVLYSDYSALRAQLEMEGLFKKDFQTLCHEHLDEKVTFWKDLTDLEMEICLPTGVRQGKVIKGEVHDPNAYNLGEFCAHAGLFGDIHKLSELLVSFNQKFDLLRFLNSASESSDKRFLYGFDRVQDLEKTLAGRGCSHKTFGHLGFTGTSMWMDSEIQRGVVILTNATQNFWFERKFLNNLRKFVGEFAWNLEK
ncbi:MAG: hypothetical protein ACPGJV_07155 [Bacteriovoracaceae bacterium]